jgi:NADPH:quinone reductase
MMTHAIRMHATGGPEVLRWEPTFVPPPGEGEVRLRHTAIGLNFIDTYHRSGLYPIELPATLGSEAAGVVEEVGPGVSGFGAGDRVVYATGPLGAYAEERNVSAAHLVKLPRDIDDRTAAATTLKGLTAQYLVRRTHRVQEGETILVHASAGGVGLLLCQWAKHLGARVIGTAGNEEKADLARAHGCDEVVLYRTEDLAERVHEITRGQRVRVVYDSIGKDTFAASLDCLAPRGLLVTFGQSSGPVPPFDPRVLSKKGSLFLTRPTLADYVRQREELEHAAAELFDLIGKGILKGRIAQTYPLRDAEEAHRDLQSRKTTGSSLLLP